MRSPKIAILGFGNAGQAFARLLLERRDAIEQQYGQSPVVTAIATRSRGSLVCPEGLELAKALDDLARSGRFDPADPCASDATALAIAEQGDYDILVELTPLEIFSGQPAIRHIEAALSRGKHAITANKGPIAWDYRRLRDLAKAQGVCFFHETTVMDGTPVFNLVEATLPLARVTRVEGILNSTTNFVLEEMEKGEPMERILAEGRRRGFVEADPSLDLLGWDAAAKTAALLNVLMDAGTTPAAIDRTGIDAVTPEDIRSAAARGKVIKLVCSGEIQNGQVLGKVAPAEVDRGSLFATITGTSSVVSITTDLMGTVSIVEHDPEILQTGYGVFSDLMRILARTAPV